MHLYQTCFIATEMQERGMEVHIYFTNIGNAGKEGVKDAFHGREERLPFNLQVQNKH